MCLIVVKPAGAKMPPEAHLRNGDDKNSDGTGVSWWKSGENLVHIKKDFKNIEELLLWMRTTITIDDALIVHFRMATSGLKDKGNRHPFPITSNKLLLRQEELTCQMSVAHNGVLSEYSGHKKYSDTQKFILDILSDPAVKDNLENPAIQKLLNEFLSRDRLAILNSSGTIWLFGEYEKEDGIMYSNAGYKYGRVSNYGEHGCNYYSSWRKEKILEYQNDEAIKTKDVSQPYYTNCDGCFKNKIVKSCDVKGELYSLCKKCRKKAKKGWLTHLVKGDIAPTIETKCDNCGLVTPKDKLVEIGDFDVCPECTKIVQNTPMN